MITRGGLRAPRRPRTTFDLARAARVSGAAAMLLSAAAGLLPLACSGVKSAADGEETGVDASSSEPGDAGSTRGDAAGESDGNGDGGEPLPRGTPRILVTGQDRPWDLALGGDRIFWTNRVVDGGVSSALKDGGDPRPVAAHQDQAAEIVAHGSSVLFTNQEPLSGEIMIAAQDGGGVMTLASADTPSAIAARAGEVFWAETASNLTYPVRRRSLAANDTSNLATYQIRVGGLFVDGSGAYWTAGGCLASCKAAVLRASLTGSGDAGPVPLYTASGPSELGGIAGDASNVYVADTEGGRILAIAKGGGSVVVLGENLRRPAKVVASGGSVYFTVMGSPNDSDGAVMKVAASGGAPPTPVATGQNGPRGLAVDATHVYWTNTRGGEVLSADK